MIAQLREVVSGDEFSALREMLQNTVKFHSSLEIVDIGRSWRPEKEDGDRKALPKRLGKRTIGMG